MFGILVDGDVMTPVEITGVSRYVVVATTREAPSCDLFLLSDWVGPLQQKHGRVVRCILGPSVLTRHVFSCL
jgi:hypothetical protein